jgi:hypothetical protein
MSAKRISTTSILVAFVVIASFLAALLPQTISPQPVQAATQVVVYNSSGTWTVPTGVTSVQVLVVAGGGGGGGAGTIYFDGGGGGAGGVVYNASYPVTPGEVITVTVGAGGGGGSGDNRGANGGNSVFGNSSYAPLITATGGGGGGGGTCGGQGVGADGGSGGGGAAPSAGCNAGSTTGQGNNGGKGNGCCNDGAGGGGGYGGVGEAGKVDGNGYGGDGGNAYDFSSTFGTSGIPNYCVFAGGGGGGGQSSGSDGGAASGRVSGGTGAVGANNGGNAVANTGGGGGGGAASWITGGKNGGSGAYGCIVIRYTTYTITYTAGSGGTVNGSWPQTVTSGSNGPWVLASANSCYHFVNWNDSSTTNPRRETNVTSDLNYTANFAIDVKTVTYSAGAGGTVNGSWPQNVNCGSDGPWVLASANPSYSFVNWSDSSTTNPRHETNVTSNLSYTANFAISNSAPNITSVTLQESGKTGNVGAMAPQTAYVVEIVAGDANTIDDISQIDIWIFRDDNAGDDGAPAGAWDADHEAIYRWAKSGSTWSIQNSSATTTWSITTGSCDTPGNMAATSGEWNLYFTVGKLAQESDGSTSEWDIKVTVTDAGSLAASNTSYSKSMGSYAALSLSSATIDFGSIALGGTAAIQTPIAHYVTLQAIANDVFALGSKSSSTWTNGGDSATLDIDGSPAAGYFSLTQDNAGDGSGHPTTPQYMTTSTVTITDLGSISRTSTAAGASESTTDTNMYMDCILGASGLKVVTYSGTITFTITNN